LRDYYPQLTEAERDEREEFCVDACYLMRDRFLGEEGCNRNGKPKEAEEYVEHNDIIKEFRGYLFMRIVPLLKDIGLWGPRVQRAFVDMGVMQFADADLDAEIANDEQAARDLDARLGHVKAVATEA